MSDLVPIKEFEGLYGVNQKGEIYSYRRKIWLSPYKTNLGYHYFKLYKNCKAFTYKRARLIAEYFMPNPKNYKIVHHKDNNAENDSIDNLEWVTHSVNIIKRKNKAKNYTWDKNKKKWMAQVMRNYKQIHLGRYSTKQEAINAVKIYLETETI